MTLEDAVLYGPERMVNGQPRTRSSWRKAVDTGLSSHVRYELPGQLRVLINLVVHRLRSDVIFECWSARYLQEIV